MIHKTSHLRVNSWWIWSYHIFFTYLNSCRNVGSSLTYFVVDLKLGTNFWQSGVMIWCSDCQTLSKTLLSKTRTLFTFWIQRFGRFEIHRRYDQFPDTFINLLRMHFNCLITLKSFYLVKCTLIFCAIFLARWTSFWLANWPITERVSLYRKLDLLLTTDQLNNGLCF